MEIHLRLEWTRIIEESRDKIKKYNKIKITDTYKMFCKSRKLTKVWHQARLDVLPLNNFLKRIRKHNTGLCTYDKEVEDKEHLIKKCKLQDKIWVNLNKQRQANYTSLLYLDRPPDFKRLVSVNLIKGLGKRRKLEKITNNKQKKQKREE